MIEHYIIWTLLLGIALTGPVAAQANREGKPAASVNIFSGRAQSATVEVDVSGVLGNALDTRIVFRDTRNRIVARFTLAEGRGICRLRPGDYLAYVYVIHERAPFLVSVKPVSCRVGSPGYLLVSLLEGGSGRRPLHEFDRDHDLVIDRVELARGTDPADSGSLPDAPALTWPSPVLSSEARWYRGELHAYSEHSIGSESVGRLIRRAESAGLDFLAITDRNTLSHTRDPRFRSNKLVLIPAMEWGNDELGYALIYRPLTMPGPPWGFAEAQGVLDRVISQRGVYAVSHPCFPAGNWQWGAEYFNAVEVWCLGWRTIPPATLQMLRPGLLELRDGELVHSMAIAVTTPARSANGQAVRFWDLESSRGLKTAAIAGSHSASPKVPLAKPVTYVYALEQSLEGILQGIRLRRTVLARDLDAPRLSFRADALNDGSIETMIGGTVPLRYETRFIVEVEGGKGDRLEIIENGVQMRSTVIYDNSLRYEFLDKPQAFRTYRARVVSAATEPGYEIFDLLAMTGPIYAQETVVVDRQTGESTWVRLESDYVNVENLGRHLPAAAGVRTPADTDRSR